MSEALPATDLARESIDTIRLLAADAVELARSGHPGTPMEAAPLAYLLFTRHLRLQSPQPGMAGAGSFRTVLRPCLHASLQHAAPDRLRPVPG